MLLLESDDGRTHRALRTAIALASPALASSVGMDTTEGRLVRVHDFGSDCISTFVAFSHGEDISFSGTDGRELWMLAEFYAISALKEWLFSSIKPSNFILVAQFAHVLLGSGPHLHELMTACEAFCKNRILEIPQACLEGCSEELARRIMLAHENVLSCVVFAQHWSEANRVSESLCMCIFGGRVDAVLMTTEILSVHMMSPATLTELLSTLAVYLEHKGSGVNVVQNKKYGGIIGCMQAYPQEIVMLASAVDCMYELVLGSEGGNVGGGASLEMMLMGARGCVVGAMMQCVCAHNFFGGDRTKREAVLRKGLYLLSAFMKQAVSSMQKESVILCDDELSVVLAAMNIEVHACGVQEQACRVLSTHSFLCNEAGCDNAVSKGVAKAVMTAMTQHHASDRVQIFAFTVITHIARVPFVATRLQELGLLRSLIIAISNHVENSNVTAHGFHALVKFAQGVALPVHMQNVITRLVVRSMRKYSKLVCLQLDACKILTLFAPESVVANGGLEPLLLALKVNSSSFSIDARLVIMHAHTS